MSADLHTRPRICRLTLREPRVENAWRVRCAVAPCVAGSELEPVGWPERSLLLVRDLGLRVRVPSLALAPQLLGPALREQVTKLSRGAARPEGGRVPVDARAVCFTDMAEALAAFALACVERRAPGQWWWRLLFPRLDPHDWLPTWKVHPTELPSAVARLSAWRALPNVAATLSEPGAQWLLRETATQFALGRLASVLDAVRDRGDIARRSTPSRDARFHPDSTLLPPNGASAAERELATWPTLVTEPALRPAVRAWLALSLGIALEPARVRSAGFAEAILELLAPAQAQRDELELAAPRELPIEPDPDHHVDAGNASTDQDGAPVSSTREESASESKSRSSVSTVLPEAGVSARGDQGPTRVSTAERPLTNAAKSQALQTNAPETWPTDEVFRSSCAGVFYLANVALALELYADFSEPARPGLELSFWDFLAGAGSRLLANQVAPSAFAADPLWAWLARMAGRAEDEAPGIGSSPPRAWCIPQAWRAWATHDHTLPEPPMLPRAWDDWFAGIVPWLELRLRLALGAPPARFLAQQGVVVRAAQRVDVHFALAEHPLEIRLAGLDRDPGWVPAAASDLRFVYE